MSTDWKTKLLRPGKRAPEGFRSLTTAVTRASTTCFPSAADALYPRVAAQPYPYGLTLTETAAELAARICELEGGHDTLLTLGGKAPVVLIYMTFLRPGDHVLIPDSVYGPSMEFANDVLKGFGVEVEFYRATIGGEIEALIKPNTRLLWCESPGSVTMEVQDVRGMAEAAHRHGVIVALDNTWAAGVLFDAFEHGVDVTMQALTKYVGGHSDILMGSVTAKDPALFKTLKAMHRHLGYGSSPDDCSLALRGLQTLAIRLEAAEKAALKVAEWVATRPEVATVLHPALPSCPGHEFFKRDFKGACGLFSFVLQPHLTLEQACEFIDRLALFEVGFSWGGVVSLALAYDPATINPERRPDGVVVRLSIGLEAVDDLIADLEQAFADVPKA